MGYFSNMSIKNNIFKIRDSNLSDKTNSFSKKTSLPVDTNNQTYYLKTQNKNALNSRGSNRYQKSPSMIEVKKESSNKSNIEENKSHTRPNSRGLKSGGRSLERSLGITMRQGIDETLKETSREHRKSNATFFNKFNLGNVIKKMKQDDSPSRKESTYLMPSSQNQQAFKRTRARPVRTVYCVRFQPVNSHE